MICDPKCPYRFHRRCVAAGKNVLDMRCCPEMKTIMKDEQAECRKTNAKQRKDC